MRFVDDDQVPHQRLERADDLRALDVVRRRQDEWVSRPRVGALVERRPPERRRIEHDRREVKSSVSSSRHCCAKSGRTQHEHVGVAAPRERFRDDQTGLHRLAETHFVGDQNSCGQPADERRAPVRAGREGWRCRRRRCAAASRSTASPAPAAWRARCRQRRCDTTRVVWTDGRRSTGSNGRRYRARLPRFDSVAADDRDDRGVRDARRTP